MTKQSLSTAVKTTLALAARGKCYNPDCTEPLITSRYGELIVNFEFAHIRDELSPKNNGSDVGWRYGPDDLTQHERNQFDNLILLCTPCHKLIDKIRPRDFSTGLLHQWKNENEGERGVELASGLRQLNFEQIEHLIVDAFRSAKSLLTFEPTTVMATAGVGATQHPVPDEFPDGMGSNENLADKRKTSWPPTYMTHAMKIPFEISNWSSMPIFNISLSFSWPYPTYKTAPTRYAAKKPYRVFSALYYQTSEDFQEMKETFEWALCRMKSETIQVSQLGPNESFSSSLIRMTDRMFVKNLRCTLLYTDSDGNRWERINNENPRPLTVEKK